MDILDMLGLESRITKAKKESPHERYARIVMDLGEAEFIGKDIKIPINGDYLAKIKYNGSATGCYFKFGNKRSSIIYASEFRKRHTPFVDFDAIYLTNETAQTGKEFIVFVGGAFAGEIEPSTGIKTGLTDSTGVDIDPAQDKRNIAHDPEVLITKVGADFAADKIAAASLKVKWAIAYNDLLCYIGVADVSPTNGLPITAGSHTTLEYVDLNKLYVVGDSTRPQLNILYVKEA